ncbi:YheU family protein [Shewanella dokdonensis]|uniref:YheU family protein n=1 Tax=Shewanella dokdonensis TaxID=712036 RepID=A0ABX8DC85_9GAMM|nr:YheU family protein [Shewanella dokdonensis]MCL1074683.1 YheU family protein [Shewanella dokdonensis]QVK22331.1 YheU family protein [Shewanella dokdonensis]
MLVPYEALLQLSAATLDNLIREYLLSQIEDGSFSDLDETAVQRASERCRHALQTGELVVEYSEEDESVAIRSREQIIQRTSTSED